METIGGTEMARLCLPVRRERVKGKVQFSPFLRLCHVEHRLVAALQLMATVVTGSPNSRNLKLVALPLRVGASGGNTVQGQCMNKSPDCSVVNATRITAQIVTL